MAARILFLEDNPREARLIQERLAQEGLDCDFVVVSDETSFARALEEGSFDAVLCDYNLPNYDGLSGLKLVKSKYPDLPVLLISGAIGEEEAVRCLHAGAADYLIKDRLERLATALQRAIQAAEDHRQRLRAEESLRENEERFRQFAEQYEDVFWFLELYPERFSFVSPSAEAVWGVSVERCYENPRAWLEMVHPDDAQRVRAAYESWLQQRTNTFDEEYKLQAPGNAERWVHNRGTTIRNKQGKVVRLSGTTKDITRNKQSERGKLLLERRMLEAQKLESLGVLTGGIAHDFNNLLTGVLTNAKLLHYDLADSELLPLVEDIETASLRAADLCKQMLAYAGQGRFVVKTIDLNQLIRDTTKLLNTTSSSTLGTNCELRFRLSELQLPVIADEAQIAQVLLNLVLNASEAIGANGGVIDITTGAQTIPIGFQISSLKAGELPAGDYSWIEVRDSGSGMEESIIAKIFEPFFTTKFTGRGLGLPAVLGIVRSHNGAISVTSEPNLGSNFKIWLPLASGKTAEPPPATPALKKTKGKILIIDDEEQVCRAVMRVLQRMGFSVDLALDAYEGLEKFEKSRPPYDLVLLDLSMPKMSGEETFKRLCLLQQNVRVLLMSGYSKDEILERFKDKGFVGFLQKPFMFDNLIDAVRRAASP